MLFLVLAWVHGWLSQQRLNLDSKMWKTKKLTTKKTAQKGRTLIIYLIHTRTYLCIHIIINGVEYTRIKTWTPSYYQTRSAHFESTHHSHAEPRRYFLANSALLFFLCTNHYNYLL